MRRLVRTPPQSSVRVLASRFRVFYSCAAAPAFMRVAAVRVYVSKKRAERVRALGKPRAGCCEWRCALLIERLSVLLQRMECIRFFLRALLCEARIATQNFLYACAVRIVYKNRIAYGACVVRDND